MKGTRIKALPVALDGYKKVLPDIKAMKEKTPVKLSAIKSPESRSIDEQRLIWSYEDIMSFMCKKRKANTWDEKAPEDELWEHSFNHAIELAQKCDVDHTVWSKFPETEKKFFEGVVYIIGYAAKKAKAYDDDLSFTAGQLRCVLEHMKKGRPTPLCAR